MATKAPIPDSNGTNIEGLLRELERLLEARLPNSIPQTVIASRVDEIALAMSAIFAHRLSDAQTTELLMYLHKTGVEQQPEVLAICAKAMREAAEYPNSDELLKLIKSRSTHIGTYDGGLCDIVGTGGDGHLTFNISTASSILCSSLLLVAKHGNRASTSRSGSSDVLAAMKVPEQPRLDAVGPDALCKVYQRTNYAFLFAPNFHKGLRHVSALRKKLSHPTIFNLLGPLANPVDAVIEARMIGVKSKDLVPVYAEALRLAGVKKAMVVCGDEDLDEISCAGLTHCARLVQRYDGSRRNIDIDYFTVAPSDFGLPEHSLNTVLPGQDPEANAAIMTKLLTNELPAAEPVLHFVLLNAAALFVVSGICDGDTDPFGNVDVQRNTEAGPGDGRWKEGVRLARQAIETGRAMAMLRRFTKVTHELSAA